MLPDPTIAAGDPRWRSASRRARNDAFEVLLFDHFLAQVRPEVLEAELPVMAGRGGCS